ncbi:MAG: HEPN domain-containing protein [Planctomycetota bacterium]
MKQHELVRLLLHKAAQDEAAMVRLLSDPDLENEILGFHAQQAVEKSLKAGLAHLGIDYPKVHSLETLLELLNAQGHPLPPDLSDVSQLTPFATVFRYEDLPLSAVFDRTDALRLVRGIRSHVEKIVEGISLNG